MSDLTRQELLTAIEAQDDLPEKVKECEKSIKEDQPELDKSQRIAICRDQLDMADDGGCPEGEIYVNGQCIESEEVDIVPPTGLAAPRFLEARYLEIGPIEREERDDGSVVYRNIKVLTEGIWTDAESRKPTHYVPENLELQDDNVLNLIHDDNNEVSEVGHVTNERHEDGDKYVDFVLHMENPASEYADENLQTALESGGAKGFGGPSVEIPPDGLEITPDGPMGYPMTEDGKISGVGLVGKQADKNVGFARQTAERSVALSDGQSPMVYTPKRIAMSDVIDLSAIDTTDDLAAVRKELEAYERALQDLDTVQDLVEQAESEGFDSSENTVEDLVAFIQGEMDVSEEDLQAIQDAADAFLETVEADSLDAVSAEAMRDWAVEQGGTDGEDEADENGGDDNGDGPDMAEKVTALEERVQALEDMLDSVMAADEVEEELEALADAEAVQELEAAIEELEEEKADLEERTRELEEEPKTPRTMADGTDDESEWEPTYDTIPSESTSW